MVSRLVSSPPVQRIQSACALAQLRQARRRGQGHTGALAVVQRARGLKRGGQQASAHWLLSRAAGILRGCDAQAIVRIEQSLTDPELEISASELAALLREADAAWAAGQDSQAGQLLELALQHLFHPRVHFGAQISPLSANPQAFFAPLRVSKAWQALTTPLQFNTPELAPRRSENRLLFISLKNWNFLQGIVDDYQADERCQVRTLDLLDLPARPTLSTLLQTRLSLARQYAQVDPGVGGWQQVIDAVGGLPEEVQADLAWADTIFVEWGSAAAVWASLVVPVVAPSARLLVRLHSYEAFTATPQLVHWGSVHTLITVAPAIRELVRASVDLPAGLQVLTLPNRAELSRYRLPKDEERARRTLALVGWAQMVKDPDWALDVLELLRQNDPSWRMLLIGPDFPPAPPVEERDYAAKVSQRIVALGDVVEITGRTDQVPQYLRRAGVILSASRREGTHQGFVEGVASGAIPVCRDWPQVSRWGGPRELFPASWIVQTPSEAAARIQALAGQKEAADAAQAVRSQTQDWVFQHADWQQVRAQYDALVLM